MNVSEIKRGAKIHAVVNLNSEDFYWLFGTEDHVGDRFVAVEALVYHPSYEEQADDSDPEFIMDGGEYGVFGAPASHIFHTNAEATAFIRALERERAIKMLNESSDMKGLLNFLVAHDAIKIPDDPIAREVLYVHMEDAGLANIIPMYEFAGV